MKIANTPSDVKITEEDVKFVRWGLYYIHRCWYCGQDFIPDYGQRRYCSVECRINAGKRREQVRKEINRTCVCEVCGVLVTKSRSKWNYCSNACRQKAYRRRKSVTVS